MSVEHYMACTTCKEAIHVAQDGASGFTFYSGMPECMEALHQFLKKHVLCSPEGCIQFVSERVVDDYENAKVLDTGGNPYADDFE